MLNKFTVLIQCNVRCKVGYSLNSVFIPEKVVFLLLVVAKIYFKVYMTRSAVISKVGGCRVDALGGAVT